MRSAWDFRRAPLIFIWEVTRACTLACRHCRAEAIPWRHPLELTTDEGRRLLEQIRDIGTPAVVLTGGDPSGAPGLRRPGGATAPSLASVSPPAPAARPG